MTLVARTATTVQALFHDSTSDTQSLKDAKDETSGSSDGSLHQIYSGEVDGESDEGSPFDSDTSLLYEQGSDDILGQLQQSMMDSDKPSTPPKDDALTVDVTKR